LECASKVTSELIKKCKSKKNNRGGSRSQKRNNLQVLREGRHAVKDWGGGMTCVVVRKGRKAKTPKR